MIATTLKPFIVNLGHRENPFKHVKWRHQNASFIICNAKPTKGRKFRDTNNGRSPTEEHSPSRNQNGGTKTTNRKKKGRYGTSRKSILKKSFAQEQIVFTAPIPDDPEVGIIGGGISGILCALALEKRGIRSTVFDTFFTVSHPRFKALVDGWLEDGLVREWNGQIGELEAGHFVPYPSMPIKYVGVNGMRPLADSILSQGTIVNVVRPCWISTLEPHNGMWHLSENGKPRGRFNAIVIAHNGKCANRLLSLSGLPLIAKQMKSDFSAPFEGAFVRGVVLSWMANNTKKLFPLQTHGPDCWTFFSTGAYGRRNKVPQENIPNVTAEKVRKEMLQGLEVSLGLPTGSLPQPIYSRVQLWGAALPTNTPGSPCIFDPHGRAGICGDWLLGSSVEAASLSGIALGNHIADYLQSGGAQPDDFAIGLQNEFHPIKGHDIGQFPGLESKEEAAQNIGIPLSIG